MCLWARKVSVSDGSTPQRGRACLNRTELCPPASPLVSLLIIIWGPLGIAGTQSQLETAGQERATACAG